MAEQIKSDSNTVLLDHFNGTTKGAGFGKLNYGDSLPTLGQAVNLPKGVYIKYAFSPWYRWDGVHKWDRNEAAPGVLTEGTIEMWIKPRQYSGILNFNWRDAVSYPPAGHIMHLGFNADGKLVYGVWGGNGDKGPVGKTTIPLNKWTHVAVSWSPTGTELYVNGKVDAYTIANVWPAFSGTPCYAYLNYWGGSDLGLVDEFHISKVARKMVLENLPIRYIEGVGDIYTKKLVTHGVKTLRNMALADVFDLNQKTGISLITLYTWKGKAELAKDIKIDGTLFSSILKMRLGDIIAMPDEELGRKASQPIEIISDLKKDISTLLISLDNAIVKRMTLENLAI
jgi:hypothetical protein